MTTRARVRAAVDLLGDDSSIRATLCRRRLERVIAIDAEAAELKRQITRLVAAADTTLTDLYGVGPLVAARFLAEVVDIRRLPEPERVRGRERHRAVAGLLRSRRPAPVQSRR
jgi:transposase